LMDLRAILFDVNGTLIDIETDEGQDKIYRTISRFLSYEGVQMAPENLRERYFATMDQQRKGSPKRYPEIDVTAIWGALLRTAGPDTPALPAAKLPKLPLFLAELHRALSHKRLELYAGVREVLDELGKTYSLGIVTDAQSAYALPELRTVGLGGLFA